MKVMLGLNTKIVNVCIEGERISTGPYPIVSGKDIVVVSGFRSILHCARCTATKHGVYSSEQ